MVASRSIRGRALPKPRHQLVRGRFVDPEGVSPSGGLDLLRWAVSRPLSPGGWTRFDVTPGRTDDDRVNGGGMHCWWVGHSTLLLQTAGLNVLTDPIWRKRCSPINGLGPARVAPPALAFESLPPIDAVVLSHDHFDHCDVHTIRRLWQRDQPLFFVPLGLERLVRRCGVKRIESAGWWDVFELAGARITCVPARHWSGRSGVDRCRTLWCGWVVSTANDGSFHYVGDTATWDAAFEAIGREFDDIRVAAIPIGAYEPRWFMASSHCDPAQAVDIFERLGAQRALAVHHSTWKLSDEAMTAPLDELAEACRAKALDDRFVAIDHGAVLRA